MPHSDVVRPRKQLGLAPSLCTAGRFHFSTRRHACRGSSFSHRVSSVHLENAPSHRVPEAPVLSWPGPGCPGASRPPARAPRSASGDTLDWWAAAISQTEGGTESGSCPVPRPGSDGPPSLLGAHRACSRGLWAVSRGPQEEDRPTSRPWALSPTQALGRGWGAVGGTWSSLPDLLEERGGLRRLKAPLFLPACGSFVHQRARRRPPAGPGARGGACGHWPPGERRGASWSELERAGAEWSLLLPAAPHVRAGCWLLPVRWVARIIWRTGSGRWAWLEPPDRLGRWEPRADAGPARDSHSHLRGGRGAPRLIPSGAGRPQCFNL